MFALRRGAWLAGWGAQHKKNRVAGEAGGARTARLMDMVADFGEHDLLLAGCQENVLTVPYRDGGMVPPPPPPPHFTQRAPAIITLIVQHASSSVPTATRVRA